MLDCSCLIHPFQNDPGTSQRQRIMEDLLDGAAKIDGRTLADLLDYFVQLSSHINHYDENLNVNDWKLFFEKSSPFAIASMIKYPVQNIEDNFTFYNTLFERKASVEGLQLGIFFIYYRFINKINDWHIALKGTGLPLEPAIEGLIKNKIQQPVKWFIKYTNAAVRYYGIKRIDFQKLSTNEIWNIDLTDLYAVDTSFSAGTNGKFKKINNLYNEFKTLYPVLLNSIKILAAAAEKDLEKSFIPLKESLQQQHQPQLALLFTFLNMFRQLQNDLNQYTRKHLDYFYKNILKFNAADAVADKAHVIFEIQKQLEHYLLKKGLKVKDGKDDKKQEILFSLDDDIVVTKTAITDKRTLFVNNQDAYARTYVEGVYMAPNAIMDDGVEKEFKDDPKNFSTLGAKYSKYADPETKLLKPFPNARLGFILASPVLFLQAGSTRTIEITLDCQLQNSICGNIGKDIITGAKSCCNESDETGNAKAIYPEFYPAKEFYDGINTVLQQSYCYISEDIIKEAIKNGLSTKTADHFRDKFLSELTPGCFCNVQKRKYDATITKTDFDTRIVLPFDPLDPTKKFTANDIAFLTDLIKPRKALTISFSGEKEWIEPSTIDELRLVPNVKPLTGPDNNLFQLTIKAVLNPDKATVTFYDKEKLKEDFGITQPAVKIELDDKIKFSDIDLAGILNEKEKEPTDCCTQSKDCCLLKHDKQGVISLYHFFRNVLINEVVPNAEIIKVSVCGLKNFIVQNDESVMDVNGPVYPFGARPDIIDINASGNLHKYFITPQLIVDAVAAGILPATQGTLNGLIAATGNYVVGGKEANIDDFLLTKITAVPADRPTLKNLLLTKNYGNKNLIGPNFFIGSQEVFCKHWTEVFINFNWKDKPSDFSEYYQGYVALQDSLDDQEFQINLSVLENGKWISEVKHEDLPLGPPYAEETTLPSITGFYNRRLFPKNVTPSSCLHENPFQQTMHLKNNFFTIADGFTLDAIAINKYDVNTRNGFLRINLQNQDFLHRDYGYVLARQMNAAAMLAITNSSGNPTITVEGAVYYDANTGNLVVFNSKSILTDIDDSVILAGNIKTDVNGPGKITALANTPVSIGPINAADAKAIRKIIYPFVFTPLPQVGDNLTGDANALKTKLDTVKTNINANTRFQAIIPKEPWTPIISGMALDYKASAAKENVDLIHLYPYTNTYKQEEIQTQPSLFPTFCDEGTLFLGLKDLVPGDNLNILFQLAEATSDSEADKENVSWYYLDSNIWKPLRKGFEVMDDATKNLTTTGIVKLSMPANMTKDNTVMPKDLHWIKAAIAKNSKAVSETVAIIPQAMLTIFTNDAANDKMRLGKLLPANSIAKLNEADAAVKSVAQPYAAFGGAVPEKESQFYVRVSETLRHKGRGIQSFDYERLALQAYPELFKVKCINHSFALNAHIYNNDFPYAPGYVTLAVIPDLNKLNAGNSFEPKLPLSIIESIETFMRKRTSPFVRFRAMNPRYEKVNFCLRVKLIKGKDENYFKEKLKQDIRELLAPWAVGKYDKLTFGQCIYRSDIIQLLETSDYVDFITDFRMGKEKADPPKAINLKVCPDTPRSILIAGDIEVCIEVPNCEKWGEYEKCNGDVVITCNTKPELIVDYCKKIKRKS